MAVMEPSGEQLTIVVDGRLAGGEKNIVTNGGVVPGSAKTTFSPNPRGRPSTIHCPSKDLHVANGELGTQNIVTPSISRSVWMPVEKLRSTYVNIHI
jgi:hypothetical protein